uniref:Kinase suppressor of Ras 2-like n=1 Tax=Saccoglossus kowalevskii TaxID=10224 RepID=A0ABM0N177_SACKO|nr:PREDICTED: kinase suppressor of Ras 2-like [Saccoglossus kowalevskii]
MSCPPKMRNTSKLHLCSTWPSFKAVESSSGEIYDWQVESQAVQYESEDIHSKLDEWKINYDDIEFNQCLKRGKNTAIYRGRWHGDVVIHTYHSSRDVNEFLEEVAILSRIRHENIELFMGVSTEPSKLAVVTSVHKGPSLFEHLHLKGEKMSVASKIHIARQIAQGVGYLHAMGITVGSKLNSRNIFLESKVKICLLGFDFVEVQNTRDDIACLPSGYLSYMAPELLRTVRVESSELVTDMQYNTTTDIFAFGTILYELFSGSWPFDGENSYALIWSLCNGDMPSLSNVDSPGQIKNIINECWSEHPLDRPLITEVVKELQHNVPLHKKHSQSEPDQLNRLSSPTHLRSPWR